MGTAQRSCSFLLAFKNALLTVGAQATGFLCVCSLVAWDLNMCIRIRTAACSLLAQGRGAYLTTTTRVRVQKIRLARPCDESIHIRPHGNLPMRYLSAPSQIQKPLSLANRHCCLLQCGMEHRNDTTMLLAFKRYAEHRIALGFCIPQRHPGQDWLRRSRHRHKGETSRCLRR